jgi:uncharacterized protein
VTDIDVLPALYDAEVIHTRRDRVRRTFKHRIYLWLVDLDALPVLPRWLRPFGRFEAADHLGAPERSIRQNLDAWLATQGVDLAGGRVVMLANARSLGYVFNPITLYWCSLPDGRTEWVVAEVHNTYGERHCYLLRPDPRGWAQTDKEFYVSPFLAMGGGYEMRVSRPGPDLAVAVSLRQHGETVLAVGLRGTRHSATRRRLVGRLMRDPFGSYRITGLIRLHGISLWLRRTPVLPRTPHVPQEGTQ